MQHNRCLVLCLIFASLIFLLLPLSGCGPDTPATYPVKGKVTFPDGSPVTGGIVGFELMIDDLTKAHNARGKILEDGSYFLTTFDKEGDGAVPGRHRVIVQEPYPEADIDEGEVLPPQAIDPKYRTYVGSGLEFEVKEEENVIDITVTQPGGG